MKHLPGESSDVPGLSFAADQLAMNVHGDVDSHIAMGLHLLDYLQFDDVLPVCEAAGRWSFLCVIAPLRLPGGTGSPVNPIAVL
jgi:hypothetical protein